MRQRTFLVLIALLTLSGCTRQATAQSINDAVNLPPGFSIEIYARVQEARTLVAVPELNAVLVGQRRGSKIHAIIDHDGDYRADIIRVVKTGLKSPNGIAWKDGYLYVAEQHRLVRFRGPTLDDIREAEAEVLYDALPDDSWHGWRYARFGPDGGLFVAVGAPCNICETNGLEGTIVRFDPVTWQPAIYASGVRNSVGLDFHPATGELYFTDNGADNMGDDSPPCELNHAPGPARWFGFPWYGGGDHRTGDFEDEPLPREPTYPIVAFGAHVAPLGIRFYDGDMFPDGYTGDAFVAQHGSWNRTIPDGYRVVRIRFENGLATGDYDIFADGFLQSNGAAWGRPVDVQPLADGSLLISDDRQGAIYRITYAE